MKVPFVDLKLQYQSIQDEIKLAVNNVLESANYVQGPFVAAFENEFAKYLNINHVACVDSGTAALYCALRALNIVPGDEVITVPNTFFATAEAVSLAGARPVFVDINPDTYLMDVSKIKLAITKNTKAIIPVHLYGQCADMDEIITIAKEHNLYVIEDACQAHGAEYKGKKAGTMGDFGCFSFYPGKNLGTYGEGGAVASNNKDLVGIVKMIRDHGSEVKYKHRLVGGNFRMSGLEGAILSVKLKYLDRWIAGRRQVAAKYREMLMGAPIKLPQELYYNKHNYHLFVVQTEKRDSLSAYLAQNGIGTGIHYPIPIHLQKAYEDCGWKEGDYPFTEKSAQEIISLPMFAELNYVQMLLIVEKIREFYKI